MSEENINIHPVDVIVEELSSTGDWWKQDCRDTFISVYDRLTDKGISESDCLEMMGDLYSAVASEFGS